MLRSESLAPASPAASRTLQTADIATILDTIPHRYPFLMVDRIIDICGDEFGIGIKNVTVNEPLFLGRSKDNLVCPGVMLIEGMAQTAGVICLRWLGIRAESKNVYFLTIDKAKFRKPVVPGDTVEYHMTKIARKGSIWRFRGEARVAGECVAEAVVSAMLGGADNGWVEPGTPNER